MRIRPLIAAGTAAVLLAAVAGCSSGGSGDDDTASSGPVTLDYWAWPADSQSVVDQWNSAHPDIQVKYTDAGGGDDSAAKLLTASRAGTAPDLVLAQYQSIPSLLVADVPADITDYVGDIKSDFSDGAWQQVTFSDKVYGVPQDVGPMALVYRQDLYAKYGITTPPTTWEEFAQDAATIHAAAPDTVIASLPPNEFAFWAAVATQNGANWWSVDGDAWTVGIADDASLEVADFFQKMFDDGTVTYDPLLTPEYDKALNDGTMLSWPSAVWAPSVLESVAEDTNGSWAMAPLPAWTEGETAVPYLGGSAILVTKNSKHPKEAAEFAKWLNASEEGNHLLIDKQALYPASNIGQQITATNDPPALMPQQTDFYSLAAKISENTIPVTWGPDVSVAQSTFIDAMTKALTNHTPLRDAFIATQKAVIDDMTKSGFTVSAEK